MASSRVFPEFEALSTLLKEQFGGTQPHQVHCADDFFSPPPLPKSSALYIISLEQRSIHITSSNGLRYW